MTIENIMAPPALAPALDRYCLARADEGKLAYPVCVSSIAWFMEGSK